MKRFTGLMVAVLLVVVRCTFGAEAAGELSGAAEAHADAIAPFVDPLTVVVVRVDMTKIDGEAVLKQIEEWQKIALKDPKELREAVADMRKELQGPKELPAAFREAGAKELYVVVSAASFPTSGPMFYVVPIGTGGNAEAIGQLIQQWNGSKKPSTAKPDPDQRSTSGMVTAQMHGAVVAADKMTLKRLGVLEASPQPQLQAAFEAVAGAGVQVLATPSPDVRAVLAAMLPMSEEKEAIREPVQSMIRSLQWVAVGVDLPPQTRVRLVVQANDAAGAKDVQAAVRKVFDNAMENAPAFNEEQKRGMRQVTQILTPEPKGSQLVQTLGPEQIGKLVEQLSPSLAKARGQAKKSFSANNLGQWGRAVHMFYGQKNAWPADFRQMMEVAMRMPYDESSDLFANPQRKNLRPAYVYRKPGLPINKIANPGEMVVFYERYDDWGDGINVCLLDGHVQFIKEQAEFEKMMARTNALDPAGSVIEAPSTQNAGAK